MIEDVYEPLAKYRDEFKERFARLTREKFKALTAASRVDVPANRKLVAAIGKLEGEADAQRFRKSCFGWLATLCFVGGVGAVIGAVVVHDANPGSAGYWVVGAAVGIALGIVMLLRFNKAAELLADLESSIASKKKMAWEQMAPLNRLYTWDITVKLIEATVPRLEYDPYFTADRLASLRTQFGWDDGFNDGKSIIFAQSGVINGSPFVFGQYLDMEWGSKTYEGTKEISWSEWVMGADGKRHCIRRYETLYGHVTKPIPVYSEQKMLVFGNDAAPALSFSRQPSGLSGDDAGLFEKLKKKWRLSRLKAYSRDLTDDSNFTLMNNHEFETWFHAKNRDNEVEFRVLFTPVAQTQMLNLMKDHEVGYGDDFTFMKQRKINVLVSQHLNKAVIDTDPARFRHWDYDAAFSNFVQFNERYFKDAYFSLAPLLAIPVYQQMRTHEDIWKGVVGQKESSFWEHEAIANYHGDEKFRHPSCITRSILKTSVTKREDGESTVAVTAYGYRGEDRVDYDEVYGGDGRLHRVPVKWTEYLPVQRTSNMGITERSNPSELFRQRVAVSRESANRRSIISYLVA